MECISHLYQKYFQLQSDKENIDTSNEEPSSLGLSPRKEALASVSYLL